MRLMGRRERVVVTWWIRSTSMLPCDPSTPSIELVRPRDGRSTASRASTFSSRAVAFTCALDRTEEALEPFPLKAIPNLAWSTDDSRVCLGHENEHHLLELSKVVGRRRWGWVWVGVWVWRGYEGDDAGEEWAEDGQKERREEMQSDVD